MTVGSVLIRGKADMGGVTKELGKTAEELTAVSDRAKPAAQDLTKVAKETGAIGERAKRTTTEIILMTSALVSLTAAAYRAYRVIEQVRDVIGTMIGKLNLASNLIIKAGAWLTGWVTTTAGLFQFMATSAAVSFESIKLGLQAVLPEGANLTAELKELEEVAKLPGLGFQEAIAGSVNLQAVGFSAEKANRALIAFGNAVASTGGGREELSRITTQLTQMASAGRVLTADLRPIIQTSPLVATALRKAFGTINAEEIENMGLTFEQFFERLVSELETLPKVTGGAKNAIENFRDAYWRMLVAFGEPLLPIVEMGFNAVASAVTTVRKVLEALPKPFRALLSLFIVLAAAIGPLLIVMGFLIKTLFALYGLLQAKRLLQYVWALRLKYKAMKNSTLATQALATVTGFLSKSFDAATGAATRLGAAIMRTSVAQRAAAAASSMSATATAAATRAKSVALPVIQAHTAAVANNTRVQAANARVTGIWAASTAKMGRVGGKLAGAISFLTFGKINLGAAKAAKSVGILSKAFKALRGLMLGPWGAAIIFTLLALGLTAKKASAQVTDSMSENEKATVKGAKKVTGALSLITGFLLYPFVRAWEQMKETVFTKMSEAANATKTGAADMVKYFADANRELASKASENQVVENLVTKWQSMNSRIDTWALDVGQRIAQNIADGMRRAGLEGLAGSIEGLFSGTSGPQMNYEDYFANAELAAEHWSKETAFNITEVSARVQFLTRALATVPEGTEGWRNIRAELVTIRQRADAFTGSLSTMGGAVSETTLEAAALGKSIDEALAGKPEKASELEQAFKAIRDEIDKMVRSGNLFMEEFLRDIGRREVEMQIKVGITPVRRGSLTQSPITGAFETVSRTLLDAADRFADALDPSGILKRGFGSPDEPGMSRGGVIAVFAAMEEAGIRLTSAQLAVYDTFLRLRDGGQELAIRWEQVKNEFKLSKVKDTGAEALQMVSGAALGLVQQFSPLGLLAKVLAGAMEMLGPLIDATLVPLTIMGEILALMIVPVLKLLFPVLKGIAIAFAWVQEKIYQAIGWLLVGVGKLLNKLPGSIGDPLIRAGKSMSETANEIRKKRKELEGMSFEGALDRVTDAANRTASALSNVPEIFEYRQRRRQAATIDPSHRYTDPARSMGPATVHNVFHISNADPRAAAREVVKIINKTTRFGATDSGLDLGTT